MNEWMKNDNKLTFTFLACTAAIFLSTSLATAFSTSFIFSRSSWADRNSTVMMCIVCEHVIMCISLYACYMLLWNDICIVCEYKM